jgi:hypothetical protein
MKKFFSKVEAFFKKVFGSSKWEKTASTTLMIVTPLLTTLLTLVAGAPVANLVGGILSTAQKDLAAAAVVLDDMDATGSTASGTAQVVNILNGVKTNLSSILSIAEIKNSTKVADITSAVNMVTDEIDAILAAAPAVASLPVSAVPAKA